MAGDVVLAPLVREPAASVDLTTMPLDLFVAGSKKESASGWGFCLVESGEEVLCEEAGAEPEVTSYRMELRGLLKGLRAVWEILVRGGPMPVALDTLQDLQFLRPVSHS